MALKKNKLIKGVDADYWKIISCDVKTGVVILGLFVNRTTAENVQDFLFKTSRVIDFPVEVLNPLEFAYNEIKKSVKRIDVQEDEEGNIVESEVEVNWFVDAEDC